MSGSSPQLAALGVRLTIVAAGKEVGAPERLEAVPVAQAQQGQRRTGAHPPTRRR